MNYRKDNGKGKVLGEHILKEIIPIAEIQEKHQTATDDQQRAITYRDNQI